MNFTESRVTKAITREGGREGGEGASAFTVETIEGRYRVERLEARYWLVIHVEAVDERPAKFT